MNDYKKHRMYTEFEQLLKDDAVFAGMYDDNENEFLAWVMDYEVNTDWEAVK